MQRASASIVPRGGEPNAAARLELAEFLLGSDHVGECAQRSAEWLSRHAGARTAVCALLDAESGELRGTAGYGVTPAQLQRLAVNRDAEDHPIAFALLQEKPIVFENGRARRAAPPL